MANPLNRNLKKGDKLVMENGAIVEVDAELFGSKPFTSGTALGVKHNGQSIRCDSFDICPERTMKMFGEVNGWNVLADRTPECMQEDHLTTREEEA